MPGIFLSEVFFSLNLVNLVYNNNNNIVKTAVKMVVDMVYLHENCSQGVELLQPSSGSRTRERAEQTPDQ
jgi:hypothetical protein